MDKRVLRQGSIILFMVILAVAFGLVIWSDPPFWLVIELLGIAVMLIVLLRWHSRRFSYTCPDCATNFRIRAVTDFVSLHTLSKKLLTCPNCGATNWCEAHRIADRQS